MARKKRTEAGSPSAVSREEGLSAGARKSEACSKSAIEISSQTRGEAGAGNGSVQQRAASAASAGKPVRQNATPVSVASATSVGGQAKKKADVDVMLESQEASLTCAASDPPAPSSPVSTNMEGLTACQRRNLKKKLRQREQKQREQERRQEEQDANGGDASFYGELQRVYVPVMRDLEARLASLEKQSSRTGVGGSELGRDFTQRLSQLERAVDEALRDVQEERLPQLKRPSTAAFKLRSQVASLKKTLEEKQRKLERLQDRVSKGLAQEDEASALVREVEETRTYLAYSRRLLETAEQFHYARELATRLTQMQASLKDLAKKVSKTAASASGPSASGGGTGDATNAASTRRAQREAVWIRRLEEMGAVFEKAESSATTNPLLFTMVLALPAEAQCFFFLPNGQSTLVLRQLQRKFLTLVERVGALPPASAVKTSAPLSVMLVSNSAENCEKCRAFLTECNFVDIPGGLAEAPNAIQIASNALSFIIGAGGRKIRALEEELRVLFYVESSWVVVLGEKPDVKQALSRLQELAASAGKAPPVGREGRSGGGSSSSSSLSVSLPSAVVRALSQGSLGLRAALKKIEESCGVTCTPRPPRRDVESEEGVVVLRAGETSPASQTPATADSQGSSSRFAEAVSQLRSLSESLEAKAIDCASSVANRVLRSDVFARLS